MKLSEWLQEKGTKGARRTQAELGRKVGLTQGRISQIADQGTADLDTALKIEAATDGKVTIADLRMESRSNSGKSPATARAAEGAGQ